MNPEELPDASIKIPLTASTRETNENVLQEGWAEHALMRESLIAEGEAIDNALKEAIRQVLVQREPNSEALAWLNSPDFEPRYLYGFVRRNIRTEVSDTEAQEEIAIHQYNRGVEWRAWYGRPEVAVARDEQFLLSQAASGSRLAAVASDLVLQEKYGDALSPEFGPEFLEQMFVEATSDRNLQQAWLIAEEVARHGQRMRKLTPEAISIWQERAQTTFLTLGEQLLALPNEDPEQIKGISKIYSELNTYEGPDRIQDIQLLQRLGRVLVARCEPGSNPSQYRNVALDAAFMFRLPKDEIVALYNRIRPLLSDRVNASYERRIAELAG